MNRMFYNRLLKHLIPAAAGLAVAFLSGCQTEELPDNREQDYGYVQFKLYKEASYAPASKASDDGLDYLNEAKKVKVTFVSGDQTMTQTLPLTASDSESAEYGLRSEKLKLVKGRYDIATFVLYGAMDEEIYESVPSDPGFEVTAGGLSVKDLTVSVTPRGKVRFSIVKDMSGIDTKSLGGTERPKEYLLEDIAYLSVEVQEKNGNTSSFNMLPAEFSIHFEEGTEDSDKGWQTSSLVCDTLLTLPAGDYEVISYRTFNANEDLLETANKGDRYFSSSSFSVADNATASAQVKIMLRKEDSYLSDCYNLKKIWEALDGEHWSYYGESFPLGCNWDFNKDPDLWNYQPGVQVHPNGRVAKIDLSGFGVKGDMPAEIGEFSELMELVIGAHSDDNIVIPDLDPSISVEARLEKTLEYHKARFQEMHKPAPMSAACALALKKHGLRSAGTAVYDNMTDDQVFMAGVTGLKGAAQPKDVVPGAMTNNLWSLPKELGKLKRLEKLYIANSPISSIEEGALSGLSSCMEIEFYNCPELGFPDEVSQLPKLAVLNISENPSWTSEDVKAGLEALGDGPAGKSLQILYCNGNSLETLPDNLDKYINASYVDFSSNKISGEIYCYGKTFAPSQLQLERNAITGFKQKDGVGSDDGEMFCDPLLLSSVSFAYNKLTKLPDIFYSENMYRISNADFSYNNISEVTDEFRGIWTTELNLGGNKFEKFPVKLLGAGSESSINYLIMSNCGIDEIPEESFEGEYAGSLISLDLQYNNLTELPFSFNAATFPYLYGLDISYNSFSEFPYGPIDCSGLTVFAIRAQRDSDGRRCLRTWPNNLYNHKGLRGFYIGSNDIRNVTEQISFMITNVEISDNPNIYFNAADICYYWMNGSYMLIYDKTQNIVNCEAMLQ